MGVERAPGLGRPQGGRAQLACGQLHSLQWAGTLNTLQAQWAPGEAQLNNHPPRLEKKNFALSRPLLRDLSSSVQFMAHR